MVRTKTSLKVTTILTMPMSCISLCFTCRPGQTSMPKHLPWNVASCIISNNVVEENRTPDSQTSHCFETAPCCWRFVSSLVFVLKLWQYVLRLPELIIRLIIKNYCKVEITLNWQDTKWRKYSHSADLQHIYFLTCWLECAPDVKNITKKTKQRCDNWVIISRPLMFVVQSNASTVHNFPHFLSCQVSFVPRLFHCHLAPTCPGLNPVKL